MENDSIELAVTEQGAHMAPVTFYKNTKPVQPYYISPWQNEPEKAGLPVLEPLRGNFFCMPFGAVNTYRKEEHPVHGEPASSEWKTKSASRQGPVTRLVLSLKTKVRPGTVTKTLSIVDGHNAVYTQHSLEGYSGKMCLGHHATLAVPEKDGSLRVTTCPIRFGMTAGRDYLCHSDREYSFLAPGAVFKNLSKVPTIWKDEPFVDLTLFPSKEGFEDVAGVYQKPGTKPSWTTAAVPSMGYLWYSLKNAEVLPQTVLWMSNKGRHAPPWNGRNRCLGLEDTCAFLADGLKMSAKKNALTEQGIATTVTLNPKKPLIINYIEGVIKIPSTFDRVTSVKFGKEDITFLSYSGKEVKTPVFWNFIENGILPKE